MQCVWVAADIALLLHISWRLSISLVCSGTAGITVMQVLAETD